MAETVDIESESIGRDEGVVRRYQLALTGALPLSDALVTEMNELFARLWPVIHELCRRFVRDEERARDLTQQVMLLTLDRIGQYRGQARFLSWVYSVTRSVCASALRRRGELLLSDGLVDPMDPRASALQDLDRLQRHALLMDSCRAALSPLEQEAVYLRYVERLPVEAITSLLGIASASGARGVLQTSRRKLQRELRRRLAEIGRGSSWVRDSL